MRSCLYLTYLTKDDTLWVHPCCCKWHYFILFCGWVIFPCIYLHIFFIHSSVNGYLGYFRVLAIVNSAATNPPHCWSEMWGHHHFVITYFKSVLSTPPWAGWRLLCSEQLRSGLEQASSVVWRRRSPETHRTSHPVLNVTLLRPWAPWASTRSLTPPAPSPSQGWPSCLFWGPSILSQPPSVFKCLSSLGRLGTMSFTLQLPWSSLLPFFSPLNPKFLKELSPFAAFTSCLFTVIYYFIHSFFLLFYFLINLSILVGG